MIWQSDGGIYSQSCASSRLAPESSSGILQNLQSQRTVVSFILSKSPHYTSSLVVFKLSGPQFKPIESEPLGVENVHLAHKQM